MIQEGSSLSGVVTAVSANAAHTFSKQPRECIHLLVGLGVEGDAHQGATVQHRSRVARDPGQTNLRQVHRIHGDTRLKLAVRTNDTSREYAAVLTDQRLGHGRCENLHRS